MEIKFIDGNTQHKIVSVLKFFFGGGLSDENKVQIKQDNKKHKMMYFLFLLLTEQIFCYKNE